MSMGFSRRCCFIHLILVMLCFYQRGMFVACMDVLLLRYALMWFQSFSVSFPEAKASVCATLR